MKSEKQFTQRELDKVTEHLQKLQKLNMSEEFKKTLKLTRVMMRLKKDDLKDQARKRHLPEKGTKEDLVKRILASTVATRANNNDNDSESRYTFFGNL